MTAVAFFGLFFVPQRKKLSAVSSCCFVPKRKRDKVLECDMGLVADVSGI